MSPDDSDQTLPVGGPSPSGLVRDNAGHILGRMLGDQPAGMEQEGDTIGPYRLIEMLGEGGFGIVWQAEQTEPVRREVALKVIKSGMDTVQVLNRFNQERQALASLDHPGIATLLNAGVTGDGRPYFAMELVRGGPVTSWCATNNAALQLRLRLFIQVCQAVQHAHEKGILHRDLKPSNILVTEVDGEPVPKVIDFGIAKAITAASSLRNPTMLTQADQVLGTPLYMSPEQVNGTKELDARTDVYALGVLLYELLTGGLPLGLTVFRSGDLLAMKRHILETLPERPSTRARRSQTRGGQDSRSPNALPPSLPADLDWITLRAMEKSRELRYASALELAEDVQRHLCHQPVRARPPSFAAAASRWIRRHRGGFIAAAAGSVLSGIVVGGALLWKSVNEADSVVKLAAHGSFTNSLGMKFAPVPGTDVLFCIHETRFQDFSAYAAAVPGTDSSWRSNALPGYDVPLKERTDHPVTHVNWEESDAFCRWLSHKEGKTYRLPTDQEWSIAAGIGGEETWTEGTTPKTVATDSKAYPWGSTWPPSEGAGNYCDEAWKRAHPSEPRRWLTGYDDGFAFTAPVMRFKPNQFGLFDMGGNVAEWVWDWADEAKKERVLRGGFWSDDAGENLQHSMLASHRIFRDYNPGIKNRNYGFRCVLETKLPATRPEFVPPIALTSSSP